MWRVLRGQQVGQMTLKTTQRLGTFSLDNVICNMQYALGTGHSLWGGGGYKMGKSRV